MMTDFLFEGKKIINVTGCSAQEGELVYEATSKSCVCCMWVHPSQPVNFVHPLINFLDNFSSNSVEPSTEPRPWV